MNMPLIITDADGNVLYSSRSVKVSGALRLFASAAAKSKKDTIVYFEGKALYTKEVLLCGRRLRFFMDSDRLYECLGVPFDMLSNGLFNVVESNKKRVTVSLKSLVRLFVSTYSEKLYDEGVRVSVHQLATDVKVEVSPSAFALCLALMIRLCANDANVVTLNFASECGRVVVYANCSGGSPLSSKAHEVLEMLLYEASAASGFAVEKTARGGKHEFSLFLSPLDISLLGLKTTPSEIYKKRIEMYIEMFL